MRLVDVYGRFYLTAADGAAPRGDVVYCALKVIRERERYARNTAGARTDDHVSLELVHGDELLLYPQPHTHRAARTTVDALLLQADTFPVRVFSFERRRAHSGRTAASGRVGLYSNAPLLQHLFPPRRVQKQRATAKKRDSPRTRGAGSPAADPDHPAAAAAAAAAAGPDDPDDPGSP